VLLLLLLMMMMMMIQLSPVNFAVYPTPQTKI
jgi:hypothetical protein